MSKSIFSTGLFTTLAAALLIGVSAQAAGNAPVWIAGDGDYNTAANWSTGAPGDGDGTSFTNNTAYTVSFAANSPIIASN
jgi:hypothetical protein